MSRLAKTALPIVILLCISAFAEPKFPAVAQWEQALRAGNMSALKNNYSVTPPAQCLTQDKKDHGISEEIAFWKSFHAAHPRSVQLIQRESADQQGVHLVSLTLSFPVHTTQGLRTRYILVDQAWQQQPGGWRIVMARRTGTVTMPQPSNLNEDIYPAGVDAKAEIRDACARAKREHKRIILVFGANWCFDCHVLDYVLHQPDFVPLVESHFVVVHVDVGEYDKNLDLAGQYKIPLKRGIPALAVLDGNGKLLYSQQEGQFENARAMNPAELTAFLQKWKP